MPLPWSRCGSYDFHEPHPDDRGEQCDGWDLSDQVSLTLITRVQEYLREHYPRGTALPAGLRLEMHPSVRRHLMTCRVLNIPGEGPGGDVTAWFRVPVKVTMDVPGETWRLVIVTEEVLLADDGNATRPGGRPG